MHTPKFTLVLAASALSLAADAPAPTLPVSVSAANYSALPWDQLRQQVANPNQVNPLTRETEPLAQPGKAPRKWTTFIALPREAHNSFAAVLPMMLKVATPYFGETTSGLQVFNDARATVKLGEFEVVETDVKSASPQR